MLERLFEEFGGILSTFKLKIDMHIERITIKDQRLKLWQETKQGSLIKSHSINLELLQSFHFSTCLFRD